jgi:hypothetical protein
LAGKGKGDGKGDGKMPQKMQKKILGSPTTQEPPIGGLPWPLASLASTKGVSTFWKQLK